MMKQCYNCKWEGEEHLLKQTTSYYGSTGIYTAMKCPNCHSSNTGDPIFAPEERYYVDIKETCWRRVQLDLDSDMSIEDFVKQIKNEGVSAIWDYEEDSDVDDFDTMDVEENGGSSTIELRRDDDKSGEIIWENGNSLVNNSNKNSTFVNDLDDIL